MNLLSNACKFQTVGTIFVKARVLFERSDLDTGSFVQVIVEDSGIGIAEKDLDKIFKPFRMQNSRGIKGNGVGLSISKQICE